jgi:hypothetical protein
LLAPLPDVVGGTAGFQHFELAKPAPQRINLWVGLDVPVFEANYNPDTDVNPKPSGLSTPTVVIDEDDPRHNPDGVDLGVDLKVQVTSIFDHGGTICP